MAPSELKPPPAWLRLCPVLQVQASHFEGLITTIVGYVLLAMTLILCHVSFTLPTGDARHTDTHITSMQLRSVVCFAAENVKDDDN